MTAPIRTVLVDDAEEMRVLVGISLALTGDFVVVGEAADGRDAIDLAAAHLPELMVLDLSMPGMDGLEALPRVLAASPRTCVVVFSGFHDSHLGTEARALGASGYIEKGTQLDELAVRLRAYVDEHRGRGPLQSRA